MRQKIPLNYNLYFFLNIHDLETLSWSSLSDISIIMEDGYLLHNSSVWVLGKIWLRIFLTPTSLPCHRLLWNFSSSILIIKITFGISESLWNLFASSKELKASSRVYSMVQNRPKQKGMHTFFQSFLMLIIILLLIIAASSLKEVNGYVL